MNRTAIGIAIVGLILFSAWAVVIFWLRADPTLVCVPLDHGTRSKAFCVLNPFRDRNAEDIAEGMLEELRNGNVAALIPYMSETTADHQQRYLDNETKYPITAWRNGEIEINGDELSIHYWVTRSNYPVREEEVRFYFVSTTNGWELNHYTAVY